MYSSTWTMYVEEVGDSVGDHLLTSAKYMVLGIMSEITDDSISVVAHGGSNKTRSGSTSNLFEGLTSIFEGLVCNLEGDALFWVK